MGEKVELTNFNFVKKWVFDYLLLKNVERYDILCQKETFMKTEQNNEILANKQNQEKDSAKASCKNTELEENYEETITDWGYMLSGAR